MVVVRVQEPRFAKTWRREALPSLKVGVLRLFRPDLIILNVYVSASPRSALVLVRHEGDNPPAR